MESLKNEYEICYAVFAVSTQLHSPRTKGQLLVIENPLVPLAGKKKLHSLGKWLLLNSKTANIHRNEYFNNFHVTKMFHVPDLNTIDTEECFI